MLVHAGLPLRQMFPVEQIQRLLQVRDGQRNLVAHKFQFADGSQSASRLEGVAILFEKVLGRVSQSKSQTVLSEDGLEIMFCLCTTQMNKRTLLLICHHHCERLHRVRLEITETAASCKRIRAEQRIELTYGDCHFDFSVIHVSRAAHIFVIEPLSRVVTQRAIRLRCIYFLHCTLQLLHIIEICRRHDMIFTACELQALADVS